MTKNEFLQQLLPRITGLPATEQQRILDYYNELVLDGVENGRDEEAHRRRFRQRGGCRL